MHFKFLKTKLNVLALYASVVFHVKANTTCALIASVCVEAEMVAHTGPLLALVDVMARAVRNTVTWVTLGPRRVYNLKLEVIVIGYS